MEELEQLYKNVGVSLQSYLLKLGCDTNTAEELVQETFLIALEHLAASPKSLNHAWFFTVARNLYFNQNKKYKRVNLTEDMEALIESRTEQPELELQRQYEEEQVRNIMLQLNESYREILILREFKDYSYNQIASQLGLTIEQVKVNLYRARLRFKQLYERSSKDEV